MLTAPFSSLYEARGVQHLTKAARHHSLAIEKARLSFPTAGFSRL